MTNETTAEHEIIETDGPECPQELDYETGERGVGVAGVKCGWPTVHYKSPGLGEWLYCSYGHETELVGA